MFFCFFLVGTSHMAPKRRNAQRHNPASRFQFTIQKSLFTTCLFIDWKSSVEVLLSLTPFVTQTISPDFGLVFICGQLERGNDGGVHFQGYLEIKGSLLITDLKQALVPVFGECSLGTHFEVAMGSRQQNIVYCSKEETQLKVNGEPKKMLWFDPEFDEVNSTGESVENNETAGAETVSAADARKEKIISYILQNAHHFASSTDMAQYAFRDTTLGGVSMRTRAFNYILQHRVGLDAIAKSNYIRTYPQPHYRQVENYIIWGTPGCGKTYAVTSGLQQMKIMYHVHTMSQGHWFDGYIDACNGTGARVIIFDDFGITSKNGDMPLAVGDMLPIMQGYKHRVQIKGGMSELSHSMVIFISNKDPDTWYNQWRIPSSEEKEAFFSRVPIRHRIHVTGGNLRVLSEDSISNIVNSEHSLAKVLETHLTQWCERSFPEIRRDVEAESETSQMRIETAASSS